MKNRIFSTILFCLTFLAIGILNAHPYDHSIIKHDLSNLEKRQKYINKIYKNTQKLYFDIKDDLASENSSKQEVVVATEYLIEIKRQLLSVSGILDLDRFLLSKIARSLKITGDEFNDEVTKSYFSCHKNNKKKT